MILSARCHPTPKITSRWIMTQPSQAADALRRAVARQAVTQQAAKTQEVPAAAREEGIEQPDSDREPQ